MEVTPVEWERWLNNLNEKLSTDEDFRRAYLATPGKAVGALGVPNELIGPLITEANQRFDPSASPDTRDRAHSDGSERRWADLDDEPDTA